MPGRNESRGESVDLLEASDSRKSSVSSINDEEESESIEVLKTGHHIPQPIPKLRSVYPSPWAIENVGEQLAEVYKSFLVRSALVAFKNPDKFLPTLEHSLARFMPFADMDIYDALPPSVYDHGKGLPEMNVVVDEKVKNFCWFPADIPLVEVTFGVTSKNPRGKLRQFMAKERVLPLTWFTFSCNSQSCKGRSKFCSKNQFVMMVLQENGKDARIVWDKDLEDICNTPIPLPKNITKEIEKLKDNRYLSNLRIRNPLLCNFGISLYRKILELALTQPGLLFHNVDDNKHSPKHGPPKEAPEPDLMAAIRKEVQDKEQLRSQREQEQRALQEQQGGEEDREEERRRRRELERERPRQPVPQSPLVIKTTKPRKNKNNGKKNKGGASKQKSQTKAKPAHTRVPRSTKSKSARSLPPIAGGEPPLSQALVEKLADIVQQDPLAVIVKDSPTIESGSLTGLHSSIEETPESSGSTTPTPPPSLRERQERRKPKQRFALHDDRLLSSLEALDASVISREAERPSQVDDDESSGLMRFAMQQSLEDVPARSSSSSSMHSGTLKSRSSRRDDSRPSS